MKILIVGDIHNEFGRLNNLINKKKPEIVICCGDFGYWPEVKWAKPLSNIKLQSAKKLLWCDGNHENHGALKIELQMNSLQIFFICQEDQLIN